MERRVAVFFMMLHVAWLWEVIIKITPLLAKENTNQSRKLPYFFNLIKSIKKTFRKHNNHCKKKIKKKKNLAMMTWKMVYEHVFLFTDYWIKNNVHVWNDWIKTQHQTIYTLDLLVLSRSNSCVFPTPLILSTSVIMPWCRNKCTWSRCSSLYCFIHTFPGM